MNIYLKFENGQQSDAVQAEASPGIDWYPAPEGFQPGQLCILDNDEPRLMTTDELAGLEARQAQQDALEATAFFAEQQARGALVAGTGNLERMGWMMKVMLVLVINNKESFPEEVITRCMQAVQAECDQRGRGESVGDLMNTWLLKFTSLALGFCTIDGKANATRDQIEQAKTTDLEVLLGREQTEADNLLSQLVQATQ